MNEGSFVGILCFITGFAAGNMLAWATTGEMTFGFIATLALGAVLIVGRRRHPEWLMITRVK